MDEKVLVQKIKKEYESPIEIALKYYSIILKLNNIPIPNRELELLAFIAVRGTISSPSARDEFIKQFQSTPGTINNMISKLSKLGLIVKQNSKYRVRPSINIDFTNKKYIFNITIKLKGNDTTE